MSETTEDLQLIQSNDGTATPQWLFDLLNGQVRSLTGQGFELDAAASDWNAKCAKYFDRDANALDQDWSQWKTIWCNPPFVRPDLEQFVAKALDAAEHGSTVVILVPSWPGYPWFQKLKLQGEMQDVFGPIQFENADGGKVVFGVGSRSMNIAIFTLGPHVVAGMNRPPIKREGAPEEIADQPPRTNEHKSTRQPRLLLMSEVQPRPTEWLWEHRIPLGELTIVDGDPSSNKSSFLLDLAARVSSKCPMIDGTAGIGGGVILLAGEDSLQKTVRRRLDVAQGDLSKIAVLDQQIYLPRDLRYLKRAIEAIQAKLIIIDPLMAFLTVDANSDQMVRTALTPLAAIADETNASVLMVRHLTKGGRNHSLYRGSGSIGIIGATRSGLLIGKSPDVPNLRVVCHTKSNLGPLASSLLFEPIDAGGVPKVEYRGECDYSADDLLASSQHHADRLAEAIEFLAAITARGPVEQKLVKEQAVAKGLAYRTIERAKEILGVKSTREGWGPGSKCLWQQPVANT